MKLADFVCFDALIPKLESTDRDGVIAELVNALDAAGKLGKGNSGKITKTVIKRENEASTGMGKSVAVPHVKSDIVSEVVAAIGMSEVGVNFSALDKQPVYSIILLISPVDDPDKHLQAMENLFHHLQTEKFRKFLRQAKTAKEIEDLICEADDNSTL